MTNYRVARRAFLRGCGGSVALLLPLLRSIEARAAGAPAPLRFLVIHHPLGTQLARWRPAATASTTSYTLGPISAPFAPLQSKMVLIDGLNIQSATRVPNGPDGANTHEGGMVALMTGQPTLGRIGQQDHAAGGASIDQILLARSPLLGGAGAPATQRTPFGSLQLAADIRSDRDEVAPRILSYLEPNEGQTDINLARRPLAPETQPLNVFNRIFGAPATTNGADTTRVLAQKKSMLDFMRADLSRLRALVPVSERVKLDVQASAIQKLESSIQASLGQLVGGVCTKPSAPPSYAATGSGYSGGKLSGFDYFDAQNPTNHPHQVVGRLQLAMVRTAFACDLVRVATFMWSAGTNWVVFPGQYGGAALAGAPTPASSPHHPPSHTTDAATLGWLEQIDKFYAMQTCEALQEFVATTDVDGNNLLDNTVVAYVTEVARAFDHNQQNVPFAIFGGKNTKLKGGTFLRVSDGPLLSQTGTAGNRPTNDVWLALAPVFGVDLPSLGARTQYVGALPGVVA